MRTILGTVLCLLVIAGTSAAQGDPFVIAVVNDGPVQDDQMVTLIQSELEALGIGPHQFLVSPQFQGDWTKNGITRAIETALSDDGVDAVLVTGGLGSALLRPLRLTKPVLVSFVQRSDHFGLHDVEGDDIAQENLSIVWIPGGLESDLVAMLSIVPVTKAYVAVHAAFAEAIADVPEQLRSLGTDTGVTFEIVAVSTDFTASAATIPYDADVVFLTMMPHLSRIQRQQFIGELTRRRIPTLSLVGHSDVHLGALAARSPDYTPKVARRVAINISEIIRGNPTSSLPVIMRVDSKMLVNGETASALGISLPIELVAFAQILHPEAINIYREPLPFGQAMRLAVVGNHNLAIAGERYQSARKTQQMASSKMLPQIGVRGFYRGTDAAGLQGLVADDELVVQGSLTQMIYDDEVVQRSREFARVRDARLEEYNTQELDTVRQAGEAYLLIALADILFEVDGQNLALTQQNLDLARLRQEVGYSGREEVLRWEAELAKGRSLLFDSRAEVEVRQVAFNQIIAVDQSLRWEPDEYQPDAAVFPFLDGRIDVNVNDTRTIQALTQFLVNIGNQRAPEVFALNYKIDARSIRLSQRKRRWWLPTFGLEAAYRYQLDRNPELPGVPKDIPLLEIGATYPIFEGARRAYDVGRQSANLRRLERERRLQRDLVEKRTRTAIARLSYSWPNVRLSQIQAQSAKANLQIVRDQYSQGLVNVTDMVSAQNESFTAARGELVAIYAFLIDLLEMQRAIAWFEFSKTDAEIEQFAAQVQQYLAQH